MTVTAVLFWLPTLASAGPIDLLLPLMGEELFSYTWENVGPSTVSTVRVTTSQETRDYTAGRVVVGDYGVLLETSHATMLYPWDQITLVEILDLSGVSSNVLVRIDDGAISSYHWGLGTSTQPNFRYKIGDTTYETMAISVIIRERFVALVTDLRMRLTLINRSRLSMVGVL